MNIRWSFVAAIAFSGALYLACGDKDADSGENDSDETLELNCESHECIYAGECITIDNSLYWCQDEDGYCETDYNTCNPAK